MLGIISRRPWLAVKVVVRAPAWRAPWMEPATPPSLCIWTTFGTWPQMFFMPKAANWSQSSAMGVDGVIG